MKSNKHLCELDSIRKQFPSPDIMHKKLGHTLGYNEYRRFDHYSAIKHGVLSPHNYNPATALYAKKDYCLGIELEIDRDAYTDAPRNYYDNMLKAIEKYFPQKCILVRDGSLSSNGVELNFIPITRLEYNQSKHRFYSLFKELSKLGYTSHENGMCGLHCHFSNNAIFQGYMDFVFVESIS